MQYELVQSQIIAIKLIPGKSRMLRAAYHCTLPPPPASKPQATASPREAKEPMLAAAEASRIQSSPADAFYVDGPGQESVLRRL
jgi:hypothetical protein